MNTCLSTNIVPHHSTERTTSPFALVCRGHISWRFWKLQYNLSPGHQFEKDWSREWLVGYSSSSYTRFCDAPYPLVCEEDFERWIKRYCHGNSQVRNGIAHSYKAEQKALKWPSLAFQTVKEMAGDKYFQNFQILLIKPYNKGYVISDISCLVYLARLTLPNAFSTTCQWQAWVQTVESHLFTCSLITTDLQ